MVCAALSTFMQTGARADDVPTPDYVFAKTRDVMLARTTPKYGIYTIAISFERDGRVWRQQYDAIEYFEDGIVRANPFSHEDEASPFIPPGGFRVAIPFIKLPRKGQLRNPLGAPRLALDYGFGLLPRTRSVSYESSETPDEAPSPSDASRVIGRVSTVARDYVVTRIGLATENGRTIDHLRLVPTHDPTILRLRELWTDAETDVPVRLRIAGNFTRPPSTDASWTVDFHTIDNTLVIDRETADEPLDFGHDGLLTRVTYAFTDVTLENKLQWLDTLGRNAEISEPDIVEP